MKFKGWLDDIVNIRTKFLGFSELRKSNAVSADDPLPEETRTTENINKVPINAKSK